MSKMDEMLFGLYQATVRLEDYEKKGGEVPENAYEAIRDSADMIMELIAMEAESEQDRRLIS